MLTNIFLLSLLTIVSSIEDGMTRDNGLPTFTDAAGQLSGNEGKSSIVFIWREFICDFYQNLIPFRRILQSEDDTNSV